MTITFQAQAKKGGNSIIIRIPKTTREIYDITEGTKLQVILRKLDEPKEVK